MSEMASKKPSNGGASKSTKTASSSSTEEEVPASAMFSKASSEKKKEATTSSVSSDEMSAAFAELRATLSAAACKSPPAVVPKERIAYEAPILKVRGEIVALGLKVTSGMRDAMRSFYVDKLLLEETPGTPYEFRPRSNPASAALRFTEVDGLHMYSGEASVYWKIGVTVHDVDALASTSFDIPCGQQFLDVGYLRHVRDPADNPVELLQTTFEASKKERAALLKEAATTMRVVHAPLAVSQITLRCRRVGMSLHFYRDYLGMTLLSVQPVPQCEFSLYFLAYTDDVPPNADDLTAVENREWLWRRPYTTIELQHVPFPDTPLYRPSTFDAIHLKVDEDRWTALCELAGRDFDQSSFSLRDPDEALVVLERDGSPSAT